MRKPFVIVAIAICAIAVNLATSGNSYATRVFGTNEVKLAYHFKTGDWNSCGVGTRCFVDKDGELQGWTITPRHIVIAHSINLKYGSTAKVRLYFIDRKTKKIVKMIPNQKNFTCWKLGKAGCYGHGSSIAYNSRTDKIWIGTSDGYFQFSDKTMQYEKMVVLPKSKRATYFTYNARDNFYFVGVSEGGGGRTVDMNFRTIKTTKTSLATNCKQWSEESPGTWNSYIITNVYRHKCNKPATIRVFNHVTGKYVKEIEISKSAIHTDVIEQVVMQEDGTMLLGVPNNNSRTGWGASTVIYAVSSKTLGLGKSTNTRIGYYNVKTITNTAKLVNTVRPNLSYY